jgi:hypothetical protein
VFWTATNAAEPMLLHLGFISQDWSTYNGGVQSVFIAKAALLEHELTLPYSAARSASFGRPHDAHQRAGRACSSRRIATDFMQLHHAAYAASCRHTPMMHAYTCASCSIAAQPGHGLNSLTLTTATRAAGRRPNMIRPVDARAMGLFLTITP